MKRLILSLILTAAAFWPARAINTTQTVEQVTTAMTLDTDVDLHITGASPFGSDGTINITNRDHAVVILEAVKPSMAIKLLSKITINGAAAKNGTNCQVRMWDRGSIILPYGGTSFKPLTVYDEDNCEGNSYTALTIGHNNGFMKDIPNAWNNRIKSFKLKRGYMVTFALRKSGRGYSRCFIAADNDLEVTLPALMSGRISSYRIFEWYNTSKAGISDMISTSNLAKLNAQTSFTWSAGSSLLPDAECVPHHIKENWPSPSDLGKCTFSPHMKTNNEPKNSSDDAPCDMDDILANWEDLMRTGMRLCTPSSWDGSDYWNATGFLADFLNEIDSRGWRCDIIDLHGYWGEGAFTTNVNNWAQTFKRPVWITEWVWGASWSGGSGIFKEASSKDNPTAADLQKNKEVVSRILDNLNSNNACERYFYWNGEANCSKLLRGGNLTPAGEYFATMKTNGPGYTNYGNYIPKAPPTSQIDDLKASFTASDGICKLTWTNRNFDLANTVTLQRRDGLGIWQTVGTWTGAELEIKTVITVEDELLTPNNYSYRVKEDFYDGMSKLSNIATMSLDAAKGTPDVQFGSITALPLDKSFNYFLEPFAKDEQPVVVTGSSTNKNNSAFLVDQVMSIPLMKENYNFFQFRLNVGKDDKETTFKNTENVGYIIARPGNGTIGALPYEAAYLPESITKDIVEVQFAQPFTEAPIVMASPILSSESAAACAWRIWDVTPEGFKIQLMQEKGVTAAIAERKMAYFAIAKGTGSNGVGTLFTVADTTLTFNSSAVASTKPINFDTEKANPIVLAQMQTFNYPATAVLRLGTTNETGTRVRMQIDKTNSQAALSLQQTATERIGYIVLSDDPDYDAISTTRTSAKALRTSFYGNNLEISDAASSASIYNAQGQLTHRATLKSGRASVNTSAWPRGIYFVRTDAQHTAKVVVR